MMQERKDKGLIQNVRPSAVDVRGQQPELFPFDAFLYTAGLHGEKRTLTLKDGWEFIVKGRIESGEGIIGGWTIEPDRLVSGAGTIRLDPVQKRVEVQDGESNVVAAMGYLGGIGSYTSGQVGVIVQTGGVFDVGSGGNFRGGDYVVQDGAAFSIKSGANEVVRLGSLGSGYYGIRIGAGDNSLDFSTETGILAIQGQITATSGQIGGWSITSLGLEKTAGDAKLLSEGVLVLGSGEDRIQLSSTDSTYRMWAGSENPSFAPFRVTKSGAVYAISGTVGGFILGSSVLKSAEGGARIELDQDKKRITVFDASGLSKVALGYLEGLKKYGTNPPEYWGASNYGFWLGEGDQAVVLEGDARFVNGNWAVENDASYIIKNALDEVIVRLGTRNGEKGLYLFENQTGTDFRAYLATTGFFVGDDENYIHYDRAGSTLSMKLTSIYMSSLATRVKGQLEISDEGDLTAGLTNPLVLATSGAGDGKVATLSQKNGIEIFLKDTPERRFVIRDEGIAMNYGLTDPTQWETVMEEDWSSGWEDRWTNHEGPGELSASDGVLTIGNNSGDDEVWYIYKTSFEYDPDYLYKMSVWVKRTEGSGLFYAGFAGRNSTDTAWVNVSGEDFYKSQHYFAASGLSPSSSFGLQVGYAKGNASSRAGGYCPYIHDPGVMYTGAVKFRPLILANYHSKAGITQVGRVLVQRIRIQNTQTTRKRSQFILNEDGLFFAPTGQNGVMEYPRLAITQSLLYTSSHRVQIGPLHPGEARYSLYNMGGYAEWFIGQKSGTDHSLKITKRISGTETDYIEIGTNGVLKLTGYDNSFWGGLRVATHIEQADHGAIAYTDPTRSGRGWLILFHGQNDRLYISKLSNKTNGFHAGVIDASGNVAIGTTDPAGYKLRVNGRLAISGVGSSPGIDVLEPGSGVFNKTAVYPNYSNTFIIEVARQSDSGGATPLAFKLTVRGGSPTWLYGDPSGNVAIGTTDPAGYKLRVNGSIGCSVHSVRRTLRSGAGEFYLYHAHMVMFYYTQIINELTRWHLDVYDGSTWRRVLSSIPDYYICALNPGRYRIVKPGGDDSMDVQSIGTFGNI